MKSTARGSTSASPPGFGVTWGGPPRVAVRGLTVAAAAALVAGMAGPAVAATSPVASARTVSVIVQELPGAGNVPEQAVAALHGTVVRPLDIINGFEAVVPGHRLDVLRTVAGVRAVTVNADVDLTSTEVESQNALPGSMHTIAQEVTGAGEMWNSGITGKGIDVAVIDSGVAPVEGLRTPGKVVYGPDLSFDAEICDEAGCEAGPSENLDGYGHGTHMAGIIAGRDSDAPAIVQKGQRQSFVGMAPDARIVSVKVADAAGATDVSQVIAAIDWVVQNKNRNGLNIRVLNLSFGTDGVQSHLLDPLAYAAEVAWHNGIVVVVAAGNGGYGSAKLNNPAYDPYVIAVGGSDTKGTYAFGDDVVPSWSSTGDGERNPDLVAPGASVVSLRVPGSYLDHTYPEGRTGTRFFRGTGTSQSAAVVAGAAALVLQQRPSITPDQVKALLMQSASNLPAADATAQGDGSVNLKKLRTSPTPSAQAATQVHPRATGLGSLELSRGTAHVAIDGTELRGETDVTGAAWVGDLRTAASVARTAWTGGGVVRSDSGQVGFTAGSWHGQQWNGHTWNADSYAGYSWDGEEWLFTPWSGVVNEEGYLEGKTWSGKTWSGKTWSGKTWSGKTWSGKTWSGKTWSGKTWSGKTWSGKTWSGIGWGI